MAQRKINWTKRANTERQEILDYWINRNKSKIYSIKLNRLFIEATRIIAQYPTLGRKTDFSPRVRLKTVRNYILFYEYNSSQIKVLSVWNTNRDEQKFRL